MDGGLSQPLRMISGAAAVVFGGIFSVSLASSLTIKVLKGAAEAKRKKVAPPCKICKGKGFYTCKLCKANSTIEWSPLHDPIFINPCVCPTCEGNRIQRCLNCLGKATIASSLLVSLPSGNVSGDASLLFVKFWFSSPSRRSGHQKRVAAKERPRSGEWSTHERLRFHTSA
ncbi:hypothetical protein H6P81_004218 [Aristolochia fimbriata]|uniref:Uncharacterized protein n=1 Tax=Aristolochia fimbriata TaxID=158543 RepID=A0AAV7FES9_ARIFI|nr:hypothetical protein H6P81_004218 [Aristolochia fimbriata]